MTTFVPWPADLPGVVELPSGARIRGRGLRGGPPAGVVDPGFGLYLLGADPGPMPWPSRWLHWPDFRLPANRAGAAAVFAETLARASSERVEIACAGGRGRTGTALACLAVLDGVPAPDAVAWVRAHYHPRAVETPGQRRFVRRFPSVS